MSGVGFYLFSIILKPPISTLKKTNNNKGYILSNVSKVKNEKKKKEEYSTTSQKPPVLDLNLFRTLVRQILITEFVKRILLG